MQMHLNFLDVRRCMFGFSSHVEAWVTAGSRAVGMVSTAQVMHRTPRLVHREDEHVREASLLGVGSARPILLGGRMVVHSLSRNGAVRTGVASRFSRMGTRGNQPRVSSADVPLIHSIEHMF